MDAVIIEAFLRKVEHSFPMPLSERQDLRAFSEKLEKYATVCAETVNGEIVAAVFGYVQHTVDNRGYISVVATAEEYRGQGLASGLVKQFLRIAEQNRLSSVHLYTAKTNLAALAMYEKIGFREWKTDREPRPDDVHLIYVFNGEVRK